MTAAIWAYSESEHVANEVTTAAKGIADRLSGEAIVVELAAERPGVASSGNKLLIVGPAKEGLSPEVAAEAIFRAARTQMPAAVMVGGTRNGKEIAARLAVKLRVGCLSDVSGLSTDGRSLSGERPEYSGKVTTRIGSNLPCVATVRVGAYPAASGGGGGIARLEVGEVPAKSNIQSVKKKEAATVDLRAAKLIVSAGRGVKKKEDLAIIEALAKSLGGTIGCSRPISSDLGWLPEEYHIGLTGINVKPDLYLAVGISGQLQHIAGIKDSKVIAAINTDKEAPIFQAADYGVVGDLYQVVPAIQKLVEAKRGR